MKGTKHRPAKADQVALQDHRRSRRARNVIAATVVTGGLLYAGTGAAFASTTGTDLTGGNGDTFFSQLEGYFKDHVLVSVLALLALTVGVSMLITWGVKAARSK